MVGLAELRAGAQKYALEPHIEYGAEVVQARYDEAAQRWTVIVALFAYILFNGIGIQAVVWLIGPEIVPLSVRGPAITANTSESSRKNSSASENTTQENTSGIFQAVSRCFWVTIHTQPTAKTADAAKSSSDSGPVCGVRFAMSSSSVAAAPAPKADKKAAAPKPVIAKKAEPPKEKDVDIPADLYLLGLAVKNRGRLITFDIRIPLTAVRGATQAHLVTL